MKKILSMVILLVLIVSLTACGRDNAISEEKETVNLEVYGEQIEDSMRKADFREAYNLCDEALKLELTENQHDTIEEYRRNILSICYPGTFVAMPESVIEVVPKSVGDDSYFTIGILKEYSEVFCRYTFNKMSEKKLAVQQYKDYLDTYYTYLDLRVDDDYTTYNYSDKTGNSIKIQVFDDDFSSADFCVFLDSNLYDLNRINTDNKRASLLDTSILIID